MQEGLEQGNIRAKQLSIFEHYVCKIALEIPTRVL